MVVLFFSRVYGVEQNAKQNKIYIRVELRCTLIVPKILGWMDKLIAPKILG